MLARSSLILRGTQRVPMLARGMQGAALGELACTCAQSRATATRAHASFILAPGLRARSFLAVPPGRVSDWYSGQLVEAEKDYLLTLPMPGMRSADMSVTFNDGMVIVEGETKTERQCFKASHQLRLPSDGNCEAACTFPADGILTIELPKVQPDTWTV